MAGPDPKKLLTLGSGSGILPSMTIRYRFEQDTPEGTWTSPDIFEAQDLRHVRQAIIAGFLMGRGYRAIDAESGALLYGLDAKGNPCK